MAKRSSFGVKMRKKLSDITNSQIHEEVYVKNEKISEINSGTEGYVDRLIKENMTLSRLLDQRNKILELSGVEIRNLRLSIHKLQVQNLTLAQTNSQFLKEINMARDTVKALQHEIMCKDALLKSNYSRPVVREGKIAAEKNLSVHEGADGNTGKHERKPSSRGRSRSVRSQSMGPSPTTRQNESQKDKDEEKSRRLRRESARFRSEEVEAKENLFEIEDIKLAISSDPMAGRSSTGRRSVRRAADKVHSYKEIPVNIKMRREE